MSKTKIKGKTLVVQLGRYMSHVLLVGSEDRVLHSTSVNTPAGSVEDGMIQDVEAVKAMLKQALRDPELRRVHQVVFTLCTSQVITETTVVPNLSEAKLEKLLQANVDMYFPVDMRDYRLVWQPIGPVERETGTKELAVQLWAVPIDMLARYYQVGNGCGLNVLAIDYCGHAIATAVGATFSKPAKGGKKAKKLDLNAPITLGKRKEQQIEPVTDTEPEHTVPDTFVYMTLERDLLGMTFVQAGQVVHQRFVQCGENLAYQFGEIPMMVEYFRSLEMGRGSSLYGILTGTMAKNPRLRTELENMLGISVETIDTPYEPRFALCVGAARTELDFGMSELNKSPRARNQLEGQLWQFGLILVGGAALIAVVMLTLSSRLVWNASINSLKSSQQTLSIQAQKYAGYADNYKSYESLYNGYSNDWDNIFNSMRTYNNNLVLALQELEDTLPENSSVVGLQINPETLDVTFACETKEEAAYLIIELRKLKYADLSMISDLQGGGGGAATDYGSDEEGEQTGEEPPTEGGNSMTQYQRSQVVELIVDTTDEDAVWELVYALSASEASQIERAYGASPTVSYNSYADAKASLAADVDRRAEAVKELLTQNFYAIYHFVDMVKEDMDRDDPYLWTEIVDDLLKDENEDILNALINHKVSDGKTAREYNARLVDILIQDDTHLTATENLLASDKAMEAWATFYLETPAQEYEELGVPYLDMNSVVDDLVDGGFDTGNKQLDSKLNALIHEDVWTEVAKYSTTDASYPDKYTEAELNQMLKKYLDNGTSGDTKLDEMIQAYMDKGTSGNARLDRLIDNYDESKQNDTPAVKPTDPKPTDPQPTDPKPTDPQPTEPSNSGSTGGNTGTGSGTESSKPTFEFANTIKKLDMSNALHYTTVCKQIDKYLAGGSTGNDSADEMIEYYLEYGTVNDSAADAVINDCMIRLIKDFNADEDTGYDNVNRVIIKYIESTPKNSGYPAINSLLRKNLSLKYLSGNATTGTETGTGTGTGGGGQAQDTRIFFTATLTYKEDLIEAEQARKGLDQGAKVDKLEVGE